jgi:hypothetical protein
MIYVTHMLARGPTSQGTRLAGASASQGASASRGAPQARRRTPASAAGVGRTVFVAEKLGVPGPPGYLTEPAVMPATRNRCSSRKPTTIGTLTVSDAAMIWFQ